MSKSDFNTFIISVSAAKTDKILILTIETEV